LHEDEIDSSCLYFEKFLGWHLFNISPNSSRIEKLKTLRPKSINFNLELSDTEKKENSTTLKLLFKKIQIDNIDLLLLNTNKNVLNILKSLHDSDIKPTVICIKNYETDSDSILTILNNLDYKLTEEIYDSSVYVQNYAINKYIWKANKQKSINSSIKPKVNIISNIFQNSNYIDSFFNQIKTLHQNNFKLETVYISTNGPKVTNEKLLKQINEAPFKVEISFDPEIDIDEFQMLERSHKWSMICNKSIFKSLSTFSDFTIFLEADLTYPPDVIDYLVEANVDVVAPVINVGSSFYDSWGYRNLNGEKISDIEFFKIDNWQAQDNREYLKELSSVGSFLSIKTSFLEKSIRLPIGYEDGMLVGLCLGIKNFNGKIYCRKDICVTHPTSYWRNQLFNTKIYLISKDRNNQLQKELVLEIDLPGFQDCYIKPQLKNVTKRIITHYYISISKSKRRSNVYCFDSKSSAKNHYESSLKTKTKNEISNLFLY